MTTIILTTTLHVNRKLKYLYQINPKDRLKLYLESILNWLTKTKFNIIVVDNSGYKFNELDNEKKKYKDRFEVISFKENELNMCKYLQRNESKGASEMFSINYAFNNSYLKEKTTFIIKVTGRFFIAGLEPFLTHDLSKYKALRQSDKNRCEMVGCHRDQFWYIFSIFLITDNFKFEPHVESIWRDRIAKCDKVIVCPTFPIKETQRGSLNEKFKTI